MDSLSAEQVHRDPSILERVKDDPEAILHIVENVLRERWIEAEQYIDPHPEWFYRYREFLLNNTCADEDGYQTSLEKYEECDYDEYTYNEYTYIENFIGSPKYAYLYVKQHLETRCIQAEEIIIKDPYYAYLYARDVIKGRWIQAEEIIASHPPSAYLYAKDIIGDQWPQAEKVVSTSPKWYALFCQIKPTAYLLPKPLQSSGWKPLFNTASMMLTT